MHMGRSRERPPMEESEWQIQLGIRRSQNSVHGKKRGRGVVLT